MTQITETAQYPTVAMNTQQPQTSDECITIAWLNLISQAVDDFSGDDWLSLCPDINEGELYRDWFVWYDADVAQEWEAYDPITNQRYVAENVTLLKAKIDQIEAIRSNISIVA